VTNGRGLLGTSLLVSYYEGASSFGCLAEHAGRERQEEVKKKKTKIYLPLLHVQGKKEEEQCRSKRHCFVPSFFFICVGTKKWVTTVTSTITIVYCPTHTHTHTHIYRKGWLTTRLSFLIILNLVSEFSAVRTLLFLSFLQPTFSLPLLNGLYSRCSRLLPHHRWCSPADQPSTSYCRWCSSSTTAAYPC